MSDLAAALHAALRDRYRLDRELGRGGMATVYLAQDLKHRRPVALKVIHPDRAQTVRPRRFRREIELAARLQHPHILGVYDSGEAEIPGGVGPVLWFAMPHVRGGSLRDRLRREGSLPLDEALRITRETAQALAYAHGEGVIHRDIKPENILLTDDGMVLVADFGIARATEASGDEESLTRTGAVMGTPAYMAPEQATGEHPVDGRADQYALAAVCYEMLTGEPPFKGPTAGAIIVARHVSPTPSARAIRPELPETVDQALERGLSLDPAERFGSVRDLARALTGDSATPSDGGTALRRRRRGWPSPLATALGLGILIGGGILFGWRRAQGPHADAAAGRTAASAAPPRIAVLPFESRGDSSVALLAEGVSDAVRGKLARLPEVRVIARGSSIPYRGAGDPPEQIAQALGVRYLLTGLVRVERSGTGSNAQVQVSPELVEIVDGVPTVRWQAPFDAPLGDAFRLESRIAGDVVSALSLALGEDGYRTLAEQPTANAKAWEAFLKGEIANEQRDNASVRRAVSHFRQAVELDSSFGLAWARLARMHSVLYATTTPDTAEARLAADALARAERLIPNHPATYHTRGLYQLFVKNDPARSIEAFDSGLAHWPQDVDLLGTAGAADRRPDRTELALARLRRAAELDPRSVPTAIRFSFRLGQERLYDESRNVADRGLEVAPTNLILLLSRVSADLGQGDADGARAVIARAAATPGMDPAALAANFAGAEDLHWLLDESQQRLVLDLPPSAFDNSRATWAMVRARMHADRGDSALARAWADTAERELRREIRASPEEPRVRLMRAVALGFLGDSAGAVREGERGMALIKDLQSGLESAYLLRQMALVYLLAGDRGRAMDRLEQLLGIKQHYSAGWLRVDPAFAGLRGEERFRTLTAGGRAEAGIGLGAA